MPKLTNTKQGDARDEELVERVMIALGLPCSSLTVRDDAQMTAHRPPLFEVAPRPPTSFGSEASRHHVPEEGHEPTTISSADQRRRSIGAASPAVRPTQHASAGQAAEEPPTTCHRHGARRFEQSVEPTD